MTYLLDTDTCIYWLKGSPSVLERVRATGLNSLAISIITVAELYFGAYNSAKVADNLKRAETFVGQVKVVPLSDAAIRRFGQIKADLRKRGQPLADFDLLIACTALAEEQVLVTNNTRHYSRVPGLELENWAA